MNIIEKDCLKLALEMLHLYGLHPHHISIRGKINNWLVLIGSSLIVSLVYLNLILSTRDVNTVAASFDAFNTFIQITTKLPWFLYYKTQLSTLLNDMAKFWPKQSTKLNLNAAKQIDSIDKLSWILCLAYRNGSCVLFFQYAAKCFINNKLPLTCWLPEDHGRIIFEVISCIEIFLIAVITIFVVGFDALVCSVLCRVAIQLRLISSFVENQVGGKVEKGEIELKRKFKKLVDYHGFVLQFCKDFENIYNVIFLIQFMISTSIFCISLYIFTETDLVNLKMSSATYMFQAFVELGLYCFPPSIVEMEGESIAKAMYAINWLNLKTKSLLKNIPIIIMRSQKPITFTAGKLTKFNNTLYISVLNSAISFYTLMKNRKN